MVIYTHIVASMSESHAASAFKEVEFEAGGVQDRYTRPVQDDSAQRRKLLANTLRTLKLSEKVCAQVEKNELTAGIKPDEEKIVVQVADNWMAMGLEPTELVFYALATIRVLSSWQFHCGSWISGIREVAIGAALDALEANRDSNLFTNLANPVQYEQRIHVLVWAVLVFSWDTLTRLCLPWKAFPNPDVNFILRLNIGR